MHVLVIGATGVLGRATTARLVVQGHRVRAMTRRPAALPGLSALGAEPVVGDLTDAASLARACTGVDRVFAAAHGMLGRGRQRSERVDDAGHRALIAAARAAGVGRFVYTSALGAALDHPCDFLRTKARVEQCLAQSGLAYTILRPAAFMEWHVHAFNGKAVLERGTAWVLGSGTKPRNFVAARDVAAFAVRALTDPSPPALMTIGGPGAHTDDDVATLYATLAGIAPRIRHVPRGVLVAIGLLAAPLHPGVARVARIAALPAERFPEIPRPGELTFDPTIPPTRLEDFVRERIAERNAGGARRMD